jgi:septum formation protein
VSASRLILASASPRRQELLAQLGHPMQIVPADVDETRRPNEPPGDLVLRLARTKARTIADRMTLQPTDVVIGADTVVTIDGDVLGKPTDDLDAADMLRRLSGRTHLVMTGVALLGRDSAHSFVETTAVEFADLSEGDIGAYVAGGEPGDKAGAYGIQGGAGRFVLSVQGSYQNIVGLPLAQVAAELLHLEAQRVHDL